MSTPASGQAFEEAIKVTPVESHRYSTVLQEDWCIGTGTMMSRVYSSRNKQADRTVPHGGYSTAVLYRLAITHFAHTHPKRYDAPATPISMQLAFLRRTGAGPAVLSVQDTKLGARTSTIHVTLAQASEKKHGELEDKITGYITVSPPTAEEGITAPTAWELYPAMPGGSAAGGRVNLEKLGETDRKSVV